MIHCKFQEVAIYPSPGEFLGVLIDAQKMTHSLPQEKVDALSDKRKEILEKEKVSVREMPRLLGSLTATIPSVLPTPLHYRYLQRDQIQSMWAGRGFEHTILFQYARSDQIFPYQQWEANNFFSFEFSGSFKCVKEGLGPLRKNLHKRDLVLFRGTTAHKHFRVDCSKICYPDFLQRLQTQGSPPSNGQSGRTGLNFKNGGGGLARIVEY